MFALFDLRRETELSAAISYEKIAAIKAKRMAKKRQTIRETDTEQRVAGAHGAGAPDAPPSQTKEGAPLVLSDSAVCAVLRDPGATNDFILNRERCNITRNSILSCHIIKVPSPMCAS